MGVLLLDPGFLGLVREYVRSVWALELLLFMRRDPERSWRAPELVRELRASNAVVGESLSRFEIAGLVSREDDGAWRFAPVSLLLHDFCDRLAEEYQTRPVAVINLIASRRRIQGLADAFKFKGEGE